MSAHKATLAGGLLLLCLAVRPTLAVAQLVSPIPPQTGTAIHAEAAPSQLPKTLTFVSIAAMVDLAVGTFITGGLVTGTELALLNSASGWLLYHVHETFWEETSPAEAPSEQRTLTKTATFSAANAVRLFGLGFLFTQNVVTTAEFLVLNVIGDAGSYIATDWIWVRVPRQVPGGL